MQDPGGKRPPDPDRDPTRRDRSLTYLLHRAGVSWKYYVAEGAQPDCDDDAMTCHEKPQTVGTPSIWNPLPYFTTVERDGQLGNVQTVDHFFTDLGDDSLPAVSWIVPNEAMSEHPPARVSAGEAYVTGLINAVMASFVVALDGDFPRVG